MAFAHHFLHHSEGHTHIPFPMYINSPYSRPTQNYPLQLFSPLLPATKFVQLTADKLIYLQLVFFLFQFSFHQQGQRIILVPVILYPCWLHSNFCFIGPYLRFLFHSPYFLIVERFPHSFHVLFPIFTLILLHYQLMIQASHIKEAKNHHPHLSYYPHYCHNHTILHLHPRKEQRRLLLKSVPYFCLEFFQFILDKVSFRMFQSPTGHGHQFPKSSTKSFHFFQLWRLYDILRIQYQQHRLIQLHQKLNYSLLYVFCSLYDQLQKRQVHLDRKSFLRLVHKNGWRHKKVFELFCFYFLC